MLQIKSFKITDGAGVSEHLRKFRLAEGASILISNGELAVPYEDGEPMNASQRVIQLKVEKEEFEQKARLILHSQRVLEIQKEGTSKAIEEENAKIKANSKRKEDYDINKSAEKEIKRLQNVIDQTDNQILMNQAELTRIMNNITAYDEKIAELSK